MLLETVLLVLGILCTTEAQDVPQTGSSGPGGDGTPNLDDLGLGNLLGQNEGGIPDFVTLITSMMGRLESLEDDVQRLSVSVAHLESVVGDEAIQGQWGEWGPYSECSVTCGDDNVQGTKTRTRECNNPAPSHGGLDCDGESTETTSCVSLKLCNVTEAPTISSHYIGGNGGGAYNDANVWEQRKITGLRMDCGRVVVSLQMKFGDQWAPKRGGGVSIWCEFPKLYDIEYEFAPDEKIIAINASSNGYTNSIQFITNKRSLNTCGTTRGRSVFQLEGPRLLYTSGRGGCYIDGMQAHWLAGGPIQGQWSSWGSFSECSVTCGDESAPGTKTRTRQCNSPAPANGGADCAGDNTETVSCVSFTLCDVTEAPIVSADYIGGQGGGAYNDRSIWDNKRITGIRMDCGRVVISLKMKFGSQWAPKRGGGISRWCEFPKTYDLEYDLDADEKIVGLNATSNGYTNSMQFITNKRVLDTCGTTRGRNVFQLTGPRLLYTSGRGGCYIDGLQAHWAASQIEGQWGSWGSFSACSVTCGENGVKSRIRLCNTASSSSGTECVGDGVESVPCASSTLCDITEAPVSSSDYIGGQGGGAYDDSAVWNNKKITAIRMDCGRVVVSLKMKFGDVWAPKRGGGISRWCAFPKTYDIEYNLDSDEKIVGLNATSNGYTNSMQFITNKRVLDTCGTTRGSNVFQLTGSRLLYTSGRAGCYIDGLQAHWAA